MNRYAVAILEQLDNVNHVYLVQADTPIEAMIQAVRDSIHGPYMDEWLDDWPSMDVTEIIEAAFDGDICISEPVQIFETSTGAC